MVDIRRQAHAVYRCRYHVVIATKYRRKVLVRGVASYLALKLLELRRHYPEVEYVTYSIQPDHVHLVLNFPPKYAAGKVVQLIKTNTSAALRERFQFMDRVFYGRGGIWSVGYFVSTVGLDEETINHYVRYQQREDVGQAPL